MTGIIASSRVSFLADILFSVKAVEVAALLTSFGTATFLSLGEALELKSFLANRRETFKALSFNVSKARVVEAVVRAFFGALLRFSFIALDSLRSVVRTQGEGDNLGIGKFILVLGKLKVTVQGSLVVALFGLHSNRVAGSKARTDARDSVIFVLVAGHS